MNRYSYQVSGSLFHSITPNPYPPTISPNYFPHYSPNSPTRSQTFPYPFLSVSRRFGNISVNLYNCYRVTNLS